MLSCGCDEHEGFWSQRTRTARKRHKCYECKASIEPGTEYEFHTHFGPGYIMNFKVCMRCNDLGESFNAMGFCWQFGELLESHQEYIDVYQPQKLTSRGGHDKQANDKRSVE